MVSPKYASNTHKDLLDGRCEMKDMMLEMDRILRPGGLVIIRDGYSYLEQSETLAKAMRWKCTRYDTELGPEDSNGLSICQKEFWQSEEAMVTEEV